MFHNLFIRLNFDIESKAFLCLVYEQQGPRKAESSSKQVLAKL